MNDASNRAKSISAANGFVSPETLGQEATTNFDHGRRSLNNAKEKKVFKRNS
jgi:hypothetical protein